MRKRISFFRHKINLLWLALFLLSISSTTMLFHQSQQVNSKTNIIKEFDNPADDENPERDNQGIKSLDFLIFKGVVELIKNLR